MNPQLSIIVVSISHEEVRARCLSALVEHTTGAACEILVVGYQADTTLKEQFPSVRWLQASPEDTVPLMRRRGISECTGEIIALLEDDCMIADTWFETILQAHQSPHNAIGGPIEPGHYERGLDWAVYFCEYARFMNPFSGEVGALPGNNVSYKRAALSAWLESGDHDGFYEVFIHSEWQYAGQTLLADSTMVVHNDNRWSLPNVTRIPYHHGRAFAGMRLTGRPFYLRILYAAAVPLLPPLQIIRIIKELATRRRHLLRLLQALPWIAAFTTSWAIGEFTGYLFGPGNSAAQWR